jgi:hypothetical protein
METTEPEAGGNWHSFAEMPRDAEEWLVLAKQVGCVWAIDPPTLDHAETDVYLCGKPRMADDRLHCGTHNTEFQRSILGVTDLLR